MLNFERRFTYGKLGVLLDKLTPLASRPIALRFAKPVRLLVLLWTITVSHNAQIIHMDVRISKLTKESKIRIIFICYDEVGLVYQYL